MLPGLVEYKKELMSFKVNTLKTYLSFSVFYVSCAVKKKTFKANIVK
jgi:hypothetical protein